MTAETITDAVGKPAEFRTCQYTGLKVDAAAQALIKANAVAAVVFLMIGGVMGLLVALTRWPAVHLLPADWFYLVLTGHGANVLLSGSSFSRLRCFISHRRSCSIHASPLRRSLGSDSC